MLGLHMLIKRAAAVTLVLFLVLLPVAPVHAIDSASSGESCDIINVAKPGTRCGEGEAKTTLGSVVGEVVGILSFVVGAAAIIMVIYGGLKYIMSGGDATKTKTARSTVMYALIGLVVAALAQVFINILTNAAS